MTSSLASITPSRRSRSVRAPASTGRRRRRGPRAPRVEGLQQQVLAREVVVGVAERHAGAFGDHAHRRRLVAVLAEQLEGRRDDAFLGALALAEERVGVGVGGDHAWTLARRCAGTSRAVLVSEANPAMPANRRSAAGRQRGVREAQRPAAVVAQRPEHDDPGVGAAVEGAVAGRHGDLREQRRELDAGSPPGPRHSAQRRSAAARASAAHRATSRRRQQKLQSPSNQVRQRTVRREVGGFHGSPRAPGGQRSRRAAPGAALAGGACRRMRLNTNRLKKCMPPSTTSTRPTLSLSASTASVGVVDVLRELQRQRHVAEVDQVEADHQEVVDRVGEVRGRRTRRSGRRGRCGAGCGRPTRSGRR
jgi:hypothetical protein